MHRASPIRGNRRPGQCPPATRVTRARGPRDVRSLGPQGDRIGGHCNGHVARPTVAGPGQRGESQGPQERSPCAPARAGVAAAASPLSVVRCPANGLLGLPPVAVPRECGGRPVSHDVLLLTLPRKALDEGAHRRAGGASGITVLLSWTASPAPAQTPPCDRTMSLRLGVGVAVAGGRAAGRGASVAPRGIGSLRPGRRTGRGLAGAPDEAPSWPSRCFRRVSRQSVGLQCPAQSVIASLVLFERRGTLPPSEGTVRHGEGCMSPERIPLELIRSGDRGGVGLRPRDERHVAAITPLSFCGLARVSTVGPVAWPRPPLLLATR